MATVSNPSYEACRVNACAALQIMTHAQRWREEVLKLEQRRLERDRTALEGALRTLRDAHDWGDFAAASQSVLRDYLGASAAIWQEGVAAAMQGAGAWTDTARDIAQDWQDSMTGLQSGTAAVSALPMREWMAAFEQTVSGASLNGVNGPAAAASGAKKQAAHAQGEQHDR